MHYLDNAATTRVLPEAAEAAVHAMCEEFGNPSSLHKMGIQASHLLEDGRKTVAAALGCLRRRLISPPAARRAPTSACAARRTWPATKKAVSSPRRSNTRRRSTPASSLLPKGSTWFISRAGRDRTHHGGCAGRGADRGHHSAVLPAGQQRDRHGAASGRAGRTSQSQSAGCVVPHRRGAGAVPREIDTEKVGTAT